MASATQKMLVLSCVILFLAIAVNAGPINQWQKDLRGKLVDFHLRGGGDGKSYNYSYNDTINISM